MKNKNINAIAIIPARGGSKRLKRKNIYPVFDKPMIFWSINAAKNSKYIKNVWVTTEDKEIKKIAMKYGSYVHDRDPKLSGDKILKMDAIRDCFSAINSDADIVVSLQANSPEINSNILDNAIEVFIKNNRNELISVGPDLMQNAVFRIIKSKYLSHKDLSIKAGAYMCDIHDIHTLEDVKFVENRND